MSSMQTFLIGLCGVAIIAMQAEAGCQLCHLRNDHTKNFSTAFEEDASEFTYCKQYSANSCCTKETASNILGLYPDWGTNCYDDPAVQALGGNSRSEECLEFFRQESCFYECDANLGRYRRHQDCGVNAWEIFKMPISAGWCDRFYEACRDDFMCVLAPQDEGYDPTVPSDGFATFNKNCTLESGRCRTFSDVYKNGRELCENYWSTAFIYEEDDEKAFQLDFEGPENPNNDIHPYVPFPARCPEESGHMLEFQSLEAGCEGHDIFGEVDPHSCHVCHLRNDHSKDLSDAEPELGGPCAKYSENACCAPETVNDLVNLYGDDYRWDRCYLSENSGGFPFRCARWFEAEACFYECDVNAGKFRLHPTCEENSWQMFGMPIKASECDQFYEDCRDVMMCLDPTAPSFFNVLPIEECNAESGCNRTVAELFATSTELCENLWSGAFRYEVHEAAAYSWAWMFPENSIFTPSYNPNNYLFTDVEFPNNCPGHDASEDECPEVVPVVPEATEGA